MSRLGYETRRTMIEAERDLGCPKIKWLDGEYVCVPSKSLAGKLLSEAGYQSIGTESFFVRAELFTNETPRSESIIISPAGKRLVLMNVNNSPDGVFLFLDCNDENYKV